MKTIVIADDQDSIRRLLRTTLEGPAVRIIEAPDGAEALRIARTEHPDAIVLDWLMPKMTGLEVVKALKADPRTSQLPVVMLTGRGAHADVEAISALGVAAYLVKPFSPLQMLEQIDRVLERPNPVPRPVLGPAARALSFAAAAR